MSESGSNGDGGGDSGKEWGGDLGGDWRRLGQILSGPPSGSRATAPSDSHGRSVVHAIKAAGGYTFLANTDNEFSTLHARVPGAERVLQ